jgi:hypothetical protein
MVLHCGKCGCSGELGTGWVTFFRADLDESDGAPMTGEYCPPCAAAFVGYQSDVAENYVCVWDPIKAETGKAPKLQEEARAPRRPRRRRIRRHRSEG